jgi:predicted dienelactone hydrolase
LIVVSHGNLGAFYDHHDTAETLADAGFVVAAINHRGDNSPPNFNDGADPSVMLARPIDIQRLISFMVGESPAAANIDSKRIGFFGFSAGGYTGLVLLGANPDWATVLCRFSPAISACTQTLKKAFQAQPIAPEPRIKAAVLADPPGSGIWFGPDSFAAVKVPVQLWASETGGRGFGEFGKEAREIGVRLDAVRPTSPIRRWWPNLSRADTRKQPHIWQRG